jgi:predicted metal-binding protein
MQKVKVKWRSGCVLVCTHQRPPGVSKPSCGEEQGMQLRDALKARLKEEGLKGPILCTKSGCLGVCPAHGTTVAVIPAPGSGLERQVFVVEPDESVDEVYERLVACLPPLDG